MRQFIVRILRRYPLLYRCVSKIYWALKFDRLQERIIGTRAREKHWAGKAIAAEYWANRDLPMAHLLAERIATFAPVRSILEVGCASGPNLCHLAGRFPDAELRGIDINGKAVRYGNERFAQEGIHHVSLSVGKADDLGEFKTGGFDIVFTSAVLIYIGPDKINEVVRGMLGIARRALVLVELSLLNTNMRDPLGLGVYREGLWVRDYKALLKQFIAEEGIKVTKIPEDVWPGLPWRESGTIIEAAIK